MAELNDAALLAPEQILADARTKAAALRLKAEALSKPQNEYETDMAIVSGIRRKPNARADARRQARFQREAEAWRAVERADKDVERLEWSLRHALRHATVPFTDDELKAARVIRTRSGWHKVVRVNAKSVSVATGYSWTDRVALSSVLEVR